MKNKEEKEVIDFLTGKLSVKIVIWLFSCLAQSPKLARRRRRFLLHQQKDDWAAKPLHPNTCDKNNETLVRIRIIEK